MLPRLLSTALAALVALAALPAAAASKRATVLLIPADRASSAAAMKFTGYLEDVVSKRPNYSLRESSRAFGDSTPTAALEARKRLIGALNEGKKNFAAGSFDEAEASLRTALIDAENSAAAFERCGEYCETLAYLAGAMLMKGDDQGAQDVLKNLLSIERGYRFDTAIFGKNMLVLVKDVLKNQARESLVNLTVQTSPPGGSVFLDGQEKGFAPLTIERLPAGRHLLRVERPGSITYGQLVEVGATEETTVKVKLTATPEYASLEAAIERVADELERGEGATELMKLGSKLKVDRAIVGLVRSNEQRVAIDCVLVDFASRRRLARNRRAFEGDEYGELDREVQRFGNLLLAQAEAGRDPNAKDTDDPLDSRSGLEDWDEEGGGSSSIGRGTDEPREKPKPRRKKKEEKKEEEGTGDW